MQVARSVEIDRPIEDVFAFIADARNDLQWCSCVLGCEQAAGSSCDVGARYEARHQPMRFGRPRTRLIDVCEYEPPSRIRWRQEDDDAVFDITYELEPAGQGTRFTQRDEIAWKFPRAIMPFAAPVARTLVRRRLAQQMTALKEVLEGSDGGG